MNRRMDKTKLHIGTYCLNDYACTESHIRDLKACGIDFVANMPANPSYLDLLHKHGIGAFASGVVPGWWGGDGSNAGTMEVQRPLKDYAAAAEHFADHPAIWAIDCGDEPSALDFPHCGRIIKLIEEKFPNQFGYLNLNPNYGWTAANTPDEVQQQLGTDSYPEYIAHYCAHVPTDYISYDHYLYSSDVASAYANLLAVANACHTTGRSLWIVLQVNSHDPARFISENQLRFQAYSAMAFGAEVITWACYTAGWWHNQVLDARGEKTQQYQKLKTVNAGIKALAEPYMACRRAATHFLGCWAGDPAAVMPPVQTLNTAVFSDIRTDGKLLAGEMTPREAGAPHGCFFFAADDPYDTAPRSCTLTLSTGGRKVLAYNEDGPLSLPDGDTVTLTLRSNQAVFLTAK